jgi:hypothetical protein
MRRRVAVAFAERAIKFFLGELKLFLGFFDHVNCFLPFFLEPQLCLFNFPLLNADPLFDLLLLCLVGSRRQEVLVELAVDHLNLGVVAELQTLLSTLDQFLELVVPQKGEHLLLAELLLESITVEKRAV